MQYDNKHQNELSGEKWFTTLTQLLELARQSSNEFDYERSLRYLMSMEELWDSKGLPTFSPELRFDLHNEKGKVLTKLGRYNEAVTEYQKLLDFCQDNKINPQRVAVFLEIGQLLAKVGEHDRALGFVHRALSGYRRLNESPGICKSLRNLGVIYIELGEFDDAEAAYEEAIEISQEKNLRLLNADLYNNLGTIKNIRGDWKAALECYMHSRDIYEKVGEVRKCAYTSNNIGITLMEQEQYKNARDNFISALKVATTIKDESLILILNINLIDLCIKVKDFPGAKIHCAKAFDYLKTNELKNSQLAETIKLSGKIALCEKKYELAEKRFDTALELCQELGLQFMEAEVIFEKGNLLQSTERQMEALQALEKAFQLFHHFEATGCVEKTEDLIGSIEELYLKIFEAMAFEVDQKDSYTKGHSDRVANLALVIAQKLGLPEQDIKTIVAGGLLHDIGKLKIPDSILKKDGKLTAEEYEEIKSHPDAGTQLMAGTKLPWNVMPLIRHHHEKYNGEGYPAGLKGELIPLGARIICVADVFDALTSARTYRSAYMPEKALQVMKVEMSGSFDAILLDTLIELRNNGSIDHIINRQTDPDEMYKIWAQCRLSQTEIYS